MAHILGNLRKWCTFLSIILKTSLVKLCFSHIIYKTVFAVCLRSFPKCLTQHFLFYFHPSPSLLSFSNSLAISSVKAHYCGDRGTAEVPLHACVCVCVAEDLTKRITLLWHKSSYLDSGRGRKPCKQKVEMTSTHQQAQTHSKANLWTWVPLCHHTSIKCSQFFQGNSSLFRGGNKSEPRPANSPLNSHFLSVAPTAPW